jgi:hypothetical protein
MLLSINNTNTSRYIHSVVNSNSKFLHVQSNLTVAVKMQGVLLILKRNYLSSQRLILLRIKMTFTLEFLQVKCYICCIWMVPYFSCTLYLHSRSQWPSGLGRRSAAACLLRLCVRIPPGAAMSVCCECCVLSGRGICDELITRPEESYRVWRVWVSSRNLVNEEAMAHWGLLRPHPQNNIHREARVSVQKAEEWQDRQLKKCYIALKWKIMLWIFKNALIRSISRCNWQHEIMQTNKYWRRLYIYIYIYNEF